MFFPDIINKKWNNLVRPLAELLCRLGIKPNHVTLMSFLASITAAILLYFRELLAGILLIAISLILDSLDGSMARLHKYATKEGELLDTIADRISEFLIFLALVLNNSTNIMIAGLAYYAIILNTLLRKKANFDLGFKRIVIIFGYWFDFAIIFTIIFFANMLSFMIQLLILDYKKQ